MECPEILRTICSDMHEENSVLSDDLNKLEKTLITSVILYAKDNFAFT
jgi:hypothetical protein